MDETGKNLVRATLEAGADDCGPGGFGQDRDAAPGRSDTVQAERTGLDHLSTLNKLPGGNLHSRRHIGVFLFLLALLVYGCTSAATGTTPISDQQGARLTPSPAATATALRSIVPLSEQALKNAQYELPDLGVFRLIDGRYENKYGAGATQVNQVDLQSASLGDLNGDGSPDAAVTLAWNGGGSGTFVYLVALVDDGGTPKQAAVELLGDRVVIKGLSIENGQVDVALEGFAPGDPACCPSLAATRTYKLDGSKLIEGTKVEPTPLVQPSPSTVAQASAPPVSPIAARFDPEKHVCSNQPTLVLADRVWQAYAAPLKGMGGDPVKAGQDVTLNLRSKLGPDAEQYQVTVTVIAPDGSSASAEMLFKGNDWGTVTYPKEFTGAQAIVAGIYTVLWQVPSGTLSCSGFQAS